eukprot:1348840-Amorphochlora_amoeboformis.AAC.1
MTEGQAWHKRMLAVESSARDRRRGDVTQNLVLVLVLRIQSWIGQYPKLTAKWTLPNRRSNNKRLRGVQGRQGLEGGSRHSVVLLVMLRCCYAHRALAG